MFRFSSISAAVRCGILSLTVHVSAAKAQETYELPRLAIYSGQVANQTPVATFAMPVSALQFDPRVDVQSRNFAEAQADVTIRGGIFENTGFKLGALSVYDPQTGHYFAELPVAPQMLSSPRVMTGAANALTGFNAEVGSVAYDWSPIARHGELSVAAGQYATNRQGIYQGWTRSVSGNDATIGIDVEATRSESDGSIPFGDHQFERIGGRLQLRTAHSQTDLFAGRQTKFFGWLNLYTPFGFNETEDLATELVALNHREWTTPENFWQIGAYYRRNHDDYEFNRAVPGAFNPFQHTTHVRAVSLEGHQSWGPWGLGYRAQAMRDHLESTSLTAGSFKSRRYTKVAVVPEYSAQTSAGNLTLRAGASFDDTNHDASAISPIVELVLQHSPAWRWYAQYAEATQVPTYTALKSSAASGLFRGNANLQRETSRNLEGGVRFVHGEWTVDGAIFYRWDDELVDWTYKMGVTARTANPVDLGTKGIELVAQRRGKNHDLVLSYAYLDKTSDYGTATVDASFYALNYAHHRFTAAIVARLGGNFEVRLDNEYRVQADNFLRTVGGDEAFLSGVGVYYFPPAWRGAELSARLDNLWDSDFQEVPAVPAGRRQWIVGATYRW